VTPYAARRAAAFRRALPVRRAHFAGLRYHRMGREAAGRRYLCIAFTRGMDLAAGLDWAAAMGRPRAAAPRRHGLSIPRYAIARGRRAFAGRPRGYRVAARAAALRMGRAAAAVARAFAYADAYGPGYRGRAYGPAWERRWTACKAARAAYEAATGRLAPHWALAPQLAYQTPAGRRSPAYAAAERADRAATARGRNWRRYYAVEGLAEQARQAAARAAAAARRAAPPAGPVPVRKARRPTGPMGDSAGRPVLAS
jgi:hypothetical protein